MTRLPLWDAAAIEAAVSRLTAIRPAYSSILSFYGPVFAAQARSAARTAPAPIAVDAATLQMKMKEGFSLIEPASFTIDDRAAEKLLAEICSITAARGENLAEAGKALALAMDRGTAMESLFRDVLENGGRIKELAEEKDVPPDMISLLLYLAIRPSIEAGARQMAQHLEGGAEYHTCCPICGSSPIIGELDGEGRQWAYCSLCWHRWAVMRMTCLSCGGRDSAPLEYLYSEEEPEYRVYLCNGCRQYLKVVDTRKLTRGFFPPLEQVVSLHLDIRAAEKGYIHSPGAGEKDIL